MKRTYLALVALLLLQVVLILIFRSPFSDASSHVETRPLLPELSDAAPTRLEIRGADDERIGLAKQDGRWAVEDLGNFPADADKVEALLDNLANLEVRRPIVTSGRYHKNFKVAEADHEGRVLTWNEGADDPEVDLFLGTSPNYRTLHVRRAGEDAVYEVQGLMSYDVSPNGTAWIRKDLVDVDADAIVGLDLTNRSGRFRLEKRHGIWTAVSPDGVDDRTLDPEKVQGLLRAAASLNLSEGTGPVDETAHGFASPAATLVIRWSAGENGMTADQETIVRIGSQVEDQDTQRYVTRAGFGFTGTVWESSLTRLLEDTLDDLVAS